MTDPKSRSAGLDPDFRRRLGRNLRHARLDASRTLGEVAEHFGLNTNMVWRWEAGKSAPMIDRLVQLAELYGVPLDALLIHPRADAASPGFAAAMEQTATGLPQDDLDLILDFARLMRRRKQRGASAHVLPLVAEEPAAYEAPRPQRRRRGAQEEGP